MSMVFFIRLPAPFLAGPQKARVPRLGGIAHHDGGLAGAHAGVEDAHEGHHHPLEVRAAVLDPEKQRCTALVS